MNRLKKNFSEVKTPLLFGLFYSVGFILFALPFTREIFTDITAITLLLSIGVVFSFHKKWTAKTLVCFAAIIVAAFILEMLGVSTGKLFGTYQYDQSLGLKLFDTPLIIGLNWLFLVYASHDIAGHITQNSLFKIICGAGLMVLYDLVLELVAPIMKMWHFDSFYPPLSNFVTWFVVALIFHSLVEFAKIKTDNRPARFLFWIQMGFFSFIILFHITFLI